MWIYILIDPRTSLARYVGQTADISGRLSNHVGESKRNRHRAACWIRSLLKQGLRPHLEVLEQIPPDQADAAERFYIALFRALGADLTNTTDGGEGRRGPMSDASKERMRRSAKRRWRSAEERAKRSASAKALMTPEKRQRISESLKGRRKGPMPQSTKEKLRLAALRRNA